MAFEYKVIRMAKGENIINWLEEAWEIVDSYTEPAVEIHTVREEIPQMYYSTSNGSSYNNYNNNTQYKNVDYPVVVPYTAFILRRTAQAKVLYGQKDNT